MGIFDNPKIDNVFLCKRSKIPFTGADYEEITDKTREQVIMMREKEVRDMYRRIGIDGRKERYKKLMNTGSTLAEAYGMPKIHKKNMPMRGVVSQTKEKTYNLDKAAAKIMEKYETNAKSYVKSGIEIVEAMRQITRVKVGNGFSMYLVKLDVIQMYPMTPVKRAFLRAYKKMKTDKEFENAYGWTPEQVIAIAKTVQTTYFVLADGTIYNQTERRWPNWS